MTSRDGDILVLWDIDLTLVDLSGTGGTWYRHALQTVAGVTLERMPSFPGRTETAITTQLLTEHGVEPTPELIDELWRELIDVATATSPLSDVGNALPGAANVLAALAAHDGVVQSLVTGNLPEIAHHKLASFDLHTHLDFDIGGYGTVSGHRPDLVAAAVDLAIDKHGGKPSAVVVIGDTPHDVEAALACGATAIGVATGRHGHGELADAGADVVLTDLSDTSSAVSAILGQHGS